MFYFLKKQKISKKNLKKISAIDVYEDLTYNNKKFILYERKVVKILKRKVLI
jgi:hypothetical protein